MTEEDCIFCSIDEQERLIENEYCFARWDKYPVNQGHLLIIPFRHFDNYFDATDDELMSISSLMKEAKKMLDQQYQPDGYNVGVNIGIDAGQSINHVHVHLIPRYKGDVERPKGGVRGVIPAKQNYT